MKIDQLLKDVGWALTDGKSVHFEYPLDDGGKADYVLADRNGRSIAVLEAKRTSKNPRDGEAQGIRYAAQLGVPFIFLSNGEEIWFWDRERDAHPRPVDTFFSQADLERRIASRDLRRDPLTVPVDSRIAGRTYQRVCIETVCREINNGRRKMLIEMATGTGKTRTAAALMKRLFDANVVTRALFVVDRNTLAVQAEEAFVENLPNLPCYRVPRTGRRFQDEKRITVVTLQTLVNEYANYSSGYFDLIIIDECHRSIYGQWRRALDHFDGVKIGLTATPCVFRNTEELEPEDLASVRDTLRFFELDRPTYRYQLKEAIEDGYLVPYEIYRAMTVKTAAEAGFEVSRDEIDWDALDVEARTELDEVFGLNHTITVDPNALERKFSIPERNRAMVREFRHVLEQGYTGGNGVRRAPDWGKTIVFAVSKRHAETLARMFDTEFAHKKPDPTIRYADYVVSGQGPDDTVDAAAKIKRFKKEEFPQILVSVNMLDTGFDCPEVVNLIMARFTHSSILYQQMRGRGTRQSPGKERFTMFDFTGVTLRHRDEEGDQLLEDRDTYIDSATDARTALARIKPPFFLNGRAVAHFLAELPEAFEEYDNPLLTQAYSDRLKAFIEKHMLPYRLDTHPVRLTPLLPEELDRLYRSFKSKVAENPGLTEALQAFEDAWDQQATDWTQINAKEAVRRASLLAENALVRASQGQSHEFTHALNRMRNHNRFPSNDFANIFDRAYTFVNTYPNIRHPGNPACVRRDLKKEDALLSALVFVGLSACVDDLCDVVAQP